MGTEIKKPRKKRSKRALLKRAPKIHENIKQTLFIRGRNTHDVVLNCLKNLYLIKKPNAILLTEKHDILPFENVVPVEKLCQKYDSSLFILASHNKKRPDNLVIGRTYDYSLLDMFELGIESFKGSLDFENISPSIGLKPALIFAGEEFETIHLFKRVKSMFVDLFHQKETDIVHLNNLEYVISFVSLENKILMRTYRIIMNNVGEKSPCIELEPIGPFVDLVIRRSHLASDDLYKRACAKPKIKGKKIKNVKQDAFGSKLGRVHMSSQDVKKLQTRKIKALKKSRKKSKKKSMKNSKSNQE